VTAKNNGNENLLRGLGPNGKHGYQPTGGYLAPPPTKGSGAGKPENFTKAREETKAVKQKVADDPDAALEEIAANLTSLTRALIKKAERARTVPEKAVMDVIKEFRQTLEVVNEARRARGAVAEIDTIAAALDTRFAEAAARVAAVPTPPAELSA
jgi:hypothetical protein